MTSLILVLYINVGSLSNDDVEPYLKKVSNEIFNDEILKKLDATSFVIPIRDGDTRLDCLNPKFILDTEVYNDYKIKLEKLNQSLNNIIENK